MARLGVVEIDQLPAMQVLETLKSESILTARMRKFVELWKSYDPPMGAVYDVDGLEFDPIKITQELSTYFELLLRDRVNQAAKSVTLAYASGGDLDAIASRYPGGVPRLIGESDDRYRIRIWLSPNTLSPHGVYESYVFWALTAVPTLRDATAVCERGTPNVTVTIMKDGDPVSLDTSTNRNLTNFPTPTPTNVEIETVRSYVLADSRKGLTDVVSVRAPKITYIDYKIRYWLFPGWDLGTMDASLWSELAKLFERQRWLGYSHTVAAVEAALMKGGVFNVMVDSPAKDVTIEPYEVIVVRSVEMIFAGRGGFEQAIEP